MTHAPSLAEPTRSPAPVIQALIDSSPLDADARWNQWAEKGHREDAAFNRKLLRAAVFGGAVAAAAGVLWIISAV